MIFNLETSVDRFSMLAVAGILVAAAGPAAANFFTEGKALVDPRMRQENVDDAAFSRDAEALTFRTRLGWRSGKVQGF